jgi:hypothetical protein
MGAHRACAGLSPIPVDPALEFPLTLRSRIVKERSRSQFRGAEGLQCSVERASGQDFTMNPASITSVVAVM